MTVPELALVTLLLGIVSVMAFAGLISVTEATATTESRNQALAEARRAVETISRDLRAANPVDALDPVTAYNQRVSFDVYCNSGEAGCVNNLKKIVYEYDPVDFELLRTVNGATSVLLGPTGPASVARNRQRGAVVNKATDPMFTFYGSNGQAFATSGASAPTKERFRDCTRSVQIRVAVVSDISQADRNVDISTRVNLRNHNRVDC